MAKFIEIDLDGTVVRAKLNEEGAPKTSEAIWNALPFEGKAVHAQLSGEMFRMLDHAPLADDLEIEAKTSHQSPGTLVYLPSIHEIAFCVGQARFNGGASWSTLTYLGDLDGDVTEFARKGDSLDRTGAKPIKFRRAQDQASPFRGWVRKGNKKIEITLGDGKAKATLLDDLSPKTAAALLKKLPLEGDATNDTWGGQLTRLRTKVDLGNDVDGDEAQKHLSWVGYVYYLPTKKELRVTYGENDIRDASGALPAIPVAQIDAADLAAYQKSAKAQLMEGVKKLSIKAI
jgi:hypothetical protein